MPPANETAESPPTDPATPGDDAERGSEGVSLVPKKLFDCVHSWFVLSCVPVLGWPDRYRLHLRICPFQFFNDFFFWPLFHYLALYPHLDIPGVKSVRSLWYI